MNLKFTSLLGFIIALLSIVTLIERESILATGIIGITVQILAVLLIIWARMVFGIRSFHAAADPTEGGLVTTGPYRYLRHPIYAAILFFLWTVILSHSFIPNVISGVFGTSGLFIRILAEESLVKQRYPEYTEYTARTKHIIPFIY